MKRILFLILSLTLIITGCSIEQEDNLTEVKAIVEEVNVEDEVLIVKGDTLGNGAIINIKDAEIIEDNTKVEIEDINIGDKVSILIGQVALSEPAQASTSKVVILEKADISNEKGKMIIKEKEGKVRIYSENTDIRSISLVSLEKEKDILIEKDILEEKKDIKAGESIEWKLEKGISKIYWELDDGKMGEYDIIVEEKMGKEVATPVEEKNEVKKEIKRKPIKDVKLYFMLFDETDAYLVAENHEIENKIGIARHTLESLRDIKPNTKDATNPIFKDTMIQGISIKNGIATVDFSKDIEDNNFGSTAELLQVQAIVNTLTQFSTIDGVVFKVDGKDDIEGWLSHIGNVGKPFVEDVSEVK